jgi:predicted cupin superfamily sugar epimerase
MFYITFIHYAVQLSLLFLVVGFEFEDWIEGKRADLLEQFPQHKELITKLTDDSK